MPKKVSDDKKEQVRAVLMVNPDASCREIGKVVDMSYRTALDVKKDILSNDVEDIFSQQRTIKKQEFINEAWEVVSKALKLTNKRFTKALEDEDAIQEMVNIINSDKTLKGAEQQSLYRRLKDLQMTNVRDIAIALGTIYDKQALASGEPTTITESRKAIPELVKDTEAMLQELKQLTGS